jgi:hypothetical protein
MRGKKKCLEAIFILAAKCKGSGIKIVFIKKKKLGGSGSRLRDAEAYC